jgi:hypothetical protein
MRGLVTIDSLPLQQLVRAAAAAGGGGAHLVLVLLLAAFIIYKPLPREPAMLTIAHTPQFPSFPLVPVAAGCGGGGMRQQQWLSAPTRTIPATATGPTA